MERPNLPEGLPDDIERKKAMARAWFEALRDRICAAFETLEDEFGHTPLVIWPSVYERFRMALKEPFLIADGVISHREGTMNIAVTSVKAIEGIDALPLRSKDWG